MRGIFRKAGQVGLTVVELAMVLFILWFVAAIAVLAFLLQQ